MTKEELLKRIREEGVDGVIEIDGHKISVDGDGTIRFQKEDKTAFLFNHEKNMSGIYLSTSFSLRGTNDYVKWARSLAHVVGESIVIDDFESLPPEIVHNTTEVIPVEV